jgi:hypothetical protein
MIHMLQKLNRTRIISLIPLGLCVLIYSLNVFPFIFKSFTPFTYDNGRDMIEAFRIIYGHKLTLIGPTTGIPGVFHGAWAYYWLTIPFLLFKGEPFGVALTIAVINLFGLILFYFVVSKHVGKLVGFLVSLLYASSNHILAHSLHLSHNNLLPFLVVLSLFLLDRYLERKSKKNLFFFGMCISFLFEFEFGGGLFIFLFNLIFISIFLLLSKKPAVTKFKNFLVLSLAILIPLLPRIAFEMRHHFIQTIALINNFLHPEVRFYFFKNLGFFARVFDRGKTFYYLWSTVFPDIVSPLAPLFLVMLLVSMFFIFKKLPKQNKIFLTYLALLVVFVICGWIYYKDAVWSSYTSGFPVYFLTILAFSLSFIFTQPIVKKLQVDKLIVFSLFMILFISSVWRNAISPQLTTDDQSAIVNQKNAINYIYNKEKDNRNFSVGAYSPSWFSYPYDYWFMLREKNQGIELPRSLWRSKINYLIIEEGDGDFTEKQWFDKFMDKNAKFQSRIYFGKLKVEKWTL